MADYRLTETPDEGAEGAEEEITRRLVEYNLSQTANQPAAPQSPQPLRRFAYDDAGALVGGVLARTHSIPFWLEISVLWVDEAHRRRGLARRLMDECERVASQRGCRYARLATSDYQAPEFYPKLGYTRYGLLADCPPGETVSYFWKPLPPG